METKLKLPLQTLDRDTQDLRFVSIIVLFINKTIVLASTFGGQPHVTLKLSLQGWPQCIPPCLLRPNSSANNRVFKLQVLLFIEAILV